MASGCCSDTDEDESSMDPRITGTLEFLACRIEEPPSVKELAGLLHLSASRFEHLFKRETGQCFKEYLRVARMASAAAILLDPFRQVKEAAAAVGYKDMSRFARDFKKQYGQVPSRWRMSRASSFHLTAAGSAHR